MSQIVLSDPQAMMLNYVRCLDPKGYDAARKDPVLTALERRGLLRFGGTRSLPRVEAWHATQAGCDWLDARRAADLAEER